MNCYAGDKVSLLLKCISWETSNENQGSHKLQTNEWSVVGEIFGLSGEVLPSVRVMDAVDG